MYEENVPGLKVLRAVATRGTLIPGVDRGSVRGIGGGAPPFPPLQPTIIAEKNKRLPSFVGGRKANKITPFPDCQRGRAPRNRVFGSLLSLVYCP